MIKWSRMIRDGQSMYNEWRRRGMHIGFRQESKKERDG
jgi:hypothetical protein